MLTENDKLHATQRLLTVCPGGLKGWAQIPLTKTARVHIRQLPFGAPEIVYSSELLDAGFNLFGHARYQLQARKSATRVQNSNLQRSQAAER